MNIYHTTSIDSALSIMKTKVYKPYYYDLANRDIANHDNGLNCITNFNEALYFNQFTPCDKEVIITFKWLGECSTYYGFKDRWPLEKNKLYNTGWRYFIPSGNSENLYIKRIYFKKDEFDKYCKFNLLNNWRKKFKILYLINDNLLLKIIPSSIINSKKRRYKYKILSNYRKLLKRNSSRKISISK